MKLSNLLIGSMVVSGLTLIGLSTQNPKTKPTAKRSISQGHRPAALDFSLPFSKTTSDKTNMLLNDPDTSKNWGLQVSDALKAKGITQGSHGTIVAVVDTGIDVNHRDLKNNLWVNPGESGIDKNGNNKATNGIDDDENGYKDDVHGWNFVNNSNRIDDNHGHGTHIAGIIGAEGGNNFGITGIASKVSMMILKYYDPKSPGNNLENTIKAFNYATQMKAHIINYSGGGTDYSQKEYEAVRRARSQGILFVAAAGNERSNSDQQKYYPANYDLDNIISVTAINPQLQVLQSSNYGVQTVHVAAPGEEIYSTLPGNTFGTLTGTSQATAFATGLAVLIKANNPELNYLAIKEHILKTGDEYPWLRSKTGTSKKLNIYKALTALDQGVGASGVLASNSVGFKDGSFSSDPQAAQNDPNADVNTTRFVEFGKSLMRSMGTERQINNN
ncbi:S8 family serine peptidase [bacterium]|nr:S8 family serine peptidase [bacterium]